MKRGIIMSFAEEMKKEAVVPKEKDNQLQEAVKLIKKGIGIQE